MGITHHSNYIRFMEEARMDFFRQIGFDYLDFEKMGLLSPVVGLNNIRYKRPSTVGDDIEIAVTVAAIRPFVLTLRYRMYLEGALIFQGDSEHCFVDKQGKLVKVGEDNFPEFYNVMKRLQEEAGEVAS